jgi:ligand-binding sensor domain-containing protein
MLPLFLLIALSLCCACNGQGQMPPTPNKIQALKGLSGDTVTTVDGEIRGIWQDSHNNMWFASNGNGVFKYDGKTIVNFTERHGLSSNYVWMVQEAKDGNIWFKTYMRRSQGDNILCRFDGYEFKTIQTDTSLVRYHFEDGALLLDYYYDETGISAIQIPPTSPIKNEGNRGYHYDIYATHIDRMGNAWFGTCSAGLCKYDGLAYTWLSDEGLNAPIRDIFEDRNGTLWVGNNGGGLFRSDGKGFVNFSKEKNLHNPDFENNLEGTPDMLARIWKISQDPQGNLWIATIDNGIWKYDGSTVTNYTTKDGLAINNIWTIYHDTKGTLWVGTAGAGVYKFNGATFEQFISK